jgi:hypothetical protein
VFLLHAGLLVPGIVFWVIFLLLQGDMTAFVLVSDNLISRYLAADMAERQNFLDLVAVGGSVMFFIVAGFRWRDFQRDLKRENIEGGQHNE